MFSPAFIKCFDYLEKQLVNVVYGEFIKKETRKDERAPYDCILIPCYANNSIDKVLFTFLLDNNDWLMMLRMTNQSKLYIAPLYGENHRWDKVAAKII